MQVVYLGSDPGVRDLGREAEKERKIYNITLASWPHCR